MNGVLYWPLAGGFTYRFLRMNTLYIRNNTPIFKSNFLKMSEFVKRVTP